MATTASSQSEDGVSHQQKHQKSPFKLFGTTISTTTAACSTEESDPDSICKKTESVETSCNEEDSDQSDSKTKKRKKGNKSDKPILKKPDKLIPCPRCDSLETKFCYYNNYNVNQPRHFCKNCQRYWTAGGTLRNVPVGAGRRKNKHSHQQQQMHPTTNSNVMLNSATASQGFPMGMGVGGLSLGSPVINFGENMSTGGSGYLSSRIGETLSSGNAIKGREEGNWWMNIMRAAMATPKNNNIPGSPCASSASSNPAISHNNNNSFVNPNDFHQTPRKTPMFPLKFLDAKPLDNKPPESFLSSSSFLDNCTDHPNRYHR